MMESSQNKRVLLVDDEEDFCEIVMRILHKSGYEVVCAPTLEIATRELQNYDPAIILLDQNLPDGLGLSFMEKNRGMLTDKQIIFITGNSSRTIIDKAISLGAFHFLTKPFTADALNRAISQAEKYN
ncbi:MAG: response regulator [Bacteroidota bacterium]|nr:response regulator [Bacteroidota bacterium]